MRSRLFELLTRRPQVPEGFTLIELMVVMVMVGILGAIALPSFLNQRSKAQETEGRLYTGSMNRAQQAHYLEHQSFAGEPEELDLSLPSSTRYYDYIIVRSNNLVTNQAKVRQDPSLRAYAGVVAAGMEITTAVLCQSENATLAPVAAGTVDGNGQASCPGTYRQIR